MKKPNIKISNIQYPIFCLFLVSCFLFLSVVLVSAAETKSPEQNPMCWTEKECAGQFENYGWKFEKKNWEKGGPNGVCGDLGVCIPAGKTSLEIKLPTLETTTAGLGDYIRAIYIFLISIGGIVAAVLIIKGGFEWVTSGGSPERVKSAQSSIGSALMGLLLLLGSYTLLYTINPDLVRLRLPGVYMIKSIVLQTPMGAGEPCWTEGPSASECANLSQKSSDYKYGCLPIQTGGFLMGLAYEVVMLPAEIAAAELGGPLLKAGGKFAKEAVTKFISQTLSKLKTPWLKVADAFRSLRSLSPSASASLDKSASAFLDYAIKQEGLTKMEAVKTLTKAIWTASKSNALTVGKIGVVGAGALYVSSEIYSALKSNAPEPGLPGICQIRKALQEGDLCDVSAPSLCASGVCIEVVDLSGWVTGAKIGVCASGQLKSVCQTDADCQSGFQCITLVSDTKSCSDGSLNTACGSKPDICKVGFTCQDQGSGYMRCTSYTTVGLHGQCAPKAKTGEAGSCDTGLTCVNNPSWPKPEGYCSDKKAGSECYENQDCDIDPKYKIRCFGSLTSGGQNAVGKCQYVYYNSSVTNEAGTTVLSSDTFLEGEVECQGQNDCPNANCIKMPPSGEFSNCGNNVAK